MTAVQPEITTPPQTATRKEGENVTFTCDADGNPAPSFSWIKDGLVVNANSRITVSSNKLTITNVTRVDQGQYFCNATNDLGNVLSTAAILNVLCK